MPDQNPREEHKRINWPVVIAMVGWGGFGLIAWGSISQQVSGHDARLNKIERAYVAEKDLSAISAPIQQRLNRIEVQLDQLLQRQMRPAQ